MAAETAASSNPELDVQKLHSLPSEQQDLYLLTFTSDLTRHVASLDTDGASAHQVYVKKEVFKIINLSSPVATRVIRNNLGQCLAGIFSKGDRKLLFESVNELITLINSGKADKELKTKHTAVHCLGAVFEAAGDSAISIATLASTSLLKLLKPAANNAGLRAAIFKALGRIVVGVSISADEVIVKDIWRQARSASTGDKSLLVQATACETISQLVKTTSYIDNSSDVEKLQSAVFKALESSSPVVRRAGATCLADCLIKAYSASPIVVPKKKAKKSNKKKPTDEDGLEDPVERTDSPAPGASSTSVSMTLEDILRVLSAQYCRGGTHNRVRAGITLCYNLVLTGLPEGVVEAQYSTIVFHFLKEVLGSPTITSNRYRLLITRKFMRMIMQDVIGQKLLGETGQLNAIRFLVSSVIKDYPQSDIKERPEPPKEMLVGAVDILRSLIESLGGACSPVSELCREGLLQVIEHPSHTVQIHAARCLQTLVLVCPSQLLPAATICMNSVNREVGLLTGPRRSPRRCLGLAYGLAATLTAASTQPLYGSVEVYSRVLSQATTILKSSSSSDLRISNVQIQVAWIMITGLMSLGPNFVKIHLSQLLLLWKNALPKPLGKDNIGQRGLLELSFLAHVRECALSSIRAFLVYNTRLLTLDVSKRLATMLQNTAMFLTSLPAKKTSEEGNGRLTPSLQLRDYELMVRRRVFGCYRQLISAAPPGSHESLLQSSVLSLAATSFASPDSLSGTSLSSAIAASIGSADSIWDLGDNSAYGLTGLVTRLDVKPLTTDNQRAQQSWTSQRNVDANIDRIICTPTSGDLEHDAVHLCTEPSNVVPDPLETGVVNSALRLFAVCLPLQASRIQEGLLEQVSSFWASGAGQQNTPKQTAIAINIAAALLFTLKVSARETTFTAGTTRSPGFEKAMQELLHVFVIHPEPMVRTLAAEALGRLAKSAGTEFSSKEISYLVDTIISNREPTARAGCAIALGCIHAQLGSMAAGLHVKNIVNILSSLAGDPHPIVHYYALQALAKVADSSGLAFSPYVSSTLGLTAQLYVADSHNDETANLLFSNMEIEQPTCTAITTCINSLINALGPDLQDQAKSRNLILTLTYLFQMETLPLVIATGLQCLEHLSLYIPGYISFKPYVRQLHIKLASEDPDIRDAALTGLYHAMRKGAEEVLRDADPNLEDQIWLVMDETHGEGIVKNIVHDWSEQSGLQMIDVWLKRIHKVLTRVKTQRAQPENNEKTKTANGDPDVQDDEVAGFNAAPQAEKNGADLTANKQELLRWQARLAAIDCLNNILQRAEKEIARSENSPVLTALQPRIADVIRIAFSASTASVVEIRIRGIQIIGRILQIFGRVPDPDFPEATLLEQYQAQISSALTPAFAPDSSPALAAEAVGVCALFISTGIVTDVERMGRILKLLVAALEDFAKDSEAASIGELKNLSSNAQIMVKLAIFSAWADLQIASGEHIYLDDVVRPHLVTLTPLWLAALREYARLKFEPDVSTSGSSGALAGSLDTVYAALNRETLLKFYQSAWLQFVDAIASLIDEDSDFVFDALDGKLESAEEETASKASQDIRYRDEPVAFFFVLFGISFEALVTHSSSGSAAARQRTLEVIRAMKKILSPAVAGLAIYQEAIFTETMDLLDRLVLTESLEVQTEIVEIARNLCTTHPSARKAQLSSQSDENLSEDIDQLFELTRILVLVISNHVPNVSERDYPVKINMTEQTIALIILTLNALVDAAEVFPIIIKSDLHACILHIFATILSTGAFQDVLVGQALPILRRFLQGLVRDPQHETLTQLRSALGRFLIILKNAQKRDSEASVSCEKNTLLACTILVTTCAKMLPPLDPLIARFIDELADCLTNKMTTKVAAGLSRSLLFISTTVAVNVGEATTETSISAQILPRLINFMTEVSDIEGTEESRVLIAQAVTTFTLALPSDRRVPALGVIVPALLRRAATEGKNVYGDTSARLLELAAKEQDSFRSIIGAMGTEQRAMVEEVLKSAGPARGHARANSGVGAEIAQPTIALKINF